MNALPSPRPVSPPPVRPRRAASHRAKQQRKQSQRAIATEVGAKLAVNVVLAIAAVSALSRLIPYNLTQQKKLEQLQTEVEVVENRVDQLQNEFTYYFDPQQTARGMQRQSNRLFPNQYPVIWSTRRPPAPPVSTDPSQP